MRLRNVPRARDVIGESTFVVSDPQSAKGRWHEIFGNDHPLYLEIGTGKGKFILEMAGKNPNINFIGLEKYSSVLLRGVEKEDALMLPNLRFVRGEAELVTEYFEKGEIAKIYLNFSDPWPKERNAKRRLNSHQFLQRYDEILEEGGQIEFKTDNQALFEFGIDEAPEGGFRIIAITRSLHEDPVMNRDNVMTEYEERFSAKGNRICKYILERDPKRDVQAIAKAQTKLELEAKSRQKAEEDFEKRKKKEEDSQTSD